MIEGCKTCKYFIERHRGRNGGLKGVCSLSNVDMSRFKFDGTRRIGKPHGCKRWEYDGGLDLPDNWDPSQWPTRV